MNQVAKMKPPALTEMQAAYVRRMLKEDNLHELAEFFDVSHITIRNVALGNPPYDELQDPPPLKEIPRQKRRNLGGTKLKNGLREDVKKMYRKLKDNPDLLDEYREKMSESAARWGINRIIANEFDISMSYVSRIHNGHYDDEN